MEPELPKKRGRGEEDETDIYGMRAAHARMIAKAARGGTSEGPSQRVRSSSWKQEQSKSTHAVLPMVSEEEVLRRRHRFMRNDDQDRERIAIAEREAALASSRAHTLQERVEEGDEEAKVAAERERKAASTFAQEAWEIRFARKAYSKLDRSVVVVDLGRAESGGGIGFRWRTRHEAMIGKGSWFCGALGCSNTSHLERYELPVSYTETGEEREQIAAVTTSLCPSCFALLEKSAPSE